MKNSKLIKILVGSGLTLTIGLALILYSNTNPQNETIVNNGATEEEQIAWDDITTVDEAELDASNDSLNEKSPKVVSNDNSNNNSTKSVVSENTNLDDNSSDNNDTTVYNDTLLNNDNNSTNDNQGDSNNGTSNNTNNNDSSPNEPVVKPVVPPTTDNNKPENEDKPVVQPTPPIENSKPSTDDTSKPDDSETKPPSESSSFASEVEQLIFKKVNAERSKAGVSPLSYNNTMQKYARIKSKDMGDRDYFDHKNPEGQLITSQMQKDGVSYQAWGENIAYLQGYSGTSNLANQFMTNWMNSTGHRENILSTDFTSIGIGVYKIGDKYYATQEFYR